jgi:hypothetical protein
MEMGKGFVRLCRRHIIRTNLALIGIEVGVAFLVWFIFDGRQTFGPLNTYVIVCLSVVVASIAALNSMFASVSAHDSLVTTQESLELTRATQRPFLSLYPEPRPVISETNKALIEFKIQNSGSLPASDVKAELTFYDKNDEVTEDNRSKKYPSESQLTGSFLVFPNTYIHEEYELNLSDIDDVKLLQNMERGNIKFRIHITYKNLDSECLTIQTEQITRLVQRSGTRKLETIPIPPQKWT